MYTVSSGGYNAIHPDTFFMSRPNGVENYLLLLVKTPAYFKIGSHELSVPPGSALLIAPHVPYQYHGTSGEYMDDWLHFNCEGEALPNALHPLFHTPVPLDNLLQLSFYLQQILWERNYSSQKFKSQNIHMLMCVLLNKLVLAHESEQTTRFYHPYYAKLQNLRLMLLSQPYKNFSASEIAESMKISFSYFQQLYKKQFHVPFKTDLINMRIEYAKGLILNTDFKLEQIAQMSGYMNEIHFYRQFHKKTGMTPGQFKQQEKRILSEHATKEQ